MPLLRIVTSPHPSLRYPSRPVTQIDDRLREIVREMFALMYEARGIGLAANQVAVPLQFFVLNLTADRERPDQEQVFINPEIVKRHASVEDEEGCLSYPGVYAKVKRARKVRVRAYDLAGNEVTVDADDLMSRAIQHETDHLHGRLFVDLVDVDDRKAIAPKVAEIEAAFGESQARGEYPSDAEIRRMLDAWPETPPSEGV